MEDSDNASEGAASASARRAAPRKRTARRKSAASARKPPARKKKTASDARRRKAGGMQALLEEVTTRAGSAGHSLATLSEDGLEKARRALGSAGSASRRTIDRLLKQWHGMDSRKRAQFLAALLGALAAASAPIVRSRIKK